MDVSTSELFPQIAQKCNFRIFLTTHPNTIISTMFNINGEHNTYLKTAGATQGPFPQTCWRAYSETDETKEHRE